MNAQTSHDWSVKRFAVWWINTRPHNVREPVRVVCNGGALGITVYRNEEFQVQQFMFGPNVAAPEHSHPDIDSAEFLIAGSFSFGEREMKRDGPFVLIGPGEPHFAIAGPDGCSFYSIQKWLNGVAPSSVELNWVGEPMDPRHAEALCT